MQTKRGKLYIIEFDSPIGTFCKVGKSVNPKQRIETLRGYLTKIKGVTYKSSHESKTISDYDMGEKDLHACLGRYRDIELTNLVDGVQGGSECFLGSANELILDSWVLDLQWKKIKISGLSTLQKAKRLRNKLKEKDIDKQRVPFKYIASMDCEKTANNQALWYILNNHHRSLPDSESYCTMVISEEYFWETVNRVHKKTNYPIYPDVVDTTLPWLDIGKGYSYKGTIVDYMGNSLETRSIGSGYAIVTSMKYNKAKHIITLRIIQDHLNLYKELKHKYRHHDFRFHERQTYGKYVR